MTTPPLVGNIPDEMLNRGTESPTTTSLEEQSSEEDSKEEEDEADAQIADDIEKEKAISLSLNSTKAEERRSVAKIPLKVIFLRTILFNSLLWIHACRWKSYVKTEQFRILHLI